LRKFIADEVLNISPDDLDTSPYSDFSRKMVILFRQELIIVRDTGRCPLSLSVFMLLVRKEMASNAQPVEGLNSVIQKMASEAPNMRMGTAASRVHIKKGRSITADECVALHKKILAAMGTPEYLNRHHPHTEASCASAPQEAPMPAGLKRESLKIGRPALEFGHALFKAVGGFAVAGRTTSKGCAYAYRFECDGVNHDFLAHWSYYNKIMVSPGRISVDRKTFTLERPLSSKLAHDFIGEFIKPDSHRPSLLMSKWKLEWSLPHLYEASLLGNATIERLFPAPIVERKRKADGDDGDSDTDEDPGPDAELVEDLAALLRLDAGGEGGEFDHRGVPCHEADLDSDGGEKVADVATCAENSSDSSEDGDGDEEAKGAGDALVFPGLPDEHQVDAVRDYVSQALEQLADARRLNAGRAARPMLKGTISLISFRGDALFVRWTEPENLRARRITLDRFDRIQTIVAYRVDNDYFDDAEIIIRDSGGIMIQTTAGGRSPMPVWCMRLMRAHRVQTFAGPFPPDSPYGTCIVCRVVAPHDCLKECGDLLVCCKCTHAWHMNCAKRAPFDGLHIGRPMLCPVCHSHG